MNANIDAYAHATIPRRYQVQTRSGAVWEWHSGSNEQSEAFRMARDAKRTGYRTRVVDTRSGAIVPVPR